MYWRKASPEPLIHVLVFSYTGIGVVSRDFIFIIEPNLCYEQQTCVTH